jgi:hypothetical protein
MKDHPDPNSLRPTDAQASPRKVWTTPRLVCMGSVTEVTSKVGKSKHRDSKNFKNRTF